MTNFSFTSFLNNNKRAETARAYTERASAPTEKQIQYYLDLCKRKRIQPKEIKLFTFETLGKEIEQIRQLPDPASDRQIEKIKQLWQEINDLGGNLKPFSDEFLNRLTGGATGTASQLIETLMKKRMELNEVAPPSDAQLQIIVEWFLCPDIPFEYYNIQKKVFLDETTEKDGEVVKLWRYMTPDEFANEIKTKMTKKQASEFIDRYRAVFYDWRKTRITQQQIRYIRELEKRLANIYTPRQVEFAVNEEGEIIEMKHGSSRDARGDLQTVAYEPITEMQLAQMSYEEASSFIDQLKSELERKEFYRYGDIYGNEQQLLEDKRGAKDRNDAIIKEYTALNDLIYKLEAIAGYENYDLHGLIKETLLEGEDHRSEEAKNAIKEFMMQTIDFKRGFSQVMKDLGRLQVMCEESVIATAILEELAKEIMAELI